MITTYTSQCFELLDEFLLFNYEFINLFILVVLGILYLWNAHSLDVTTLDLGIKYAYYIVTVRICV